MATDDLRARLARLEAAQSPRHGGVVIAKPNETPAAAVQRAGRSGSVIVMPAVPDAETWERETVAAQQLLMARATIMATTGKTRKLTDGG